MKEELPLYARRNQNGQIEVATCPYDWIPLRSGCSIALPQYRSACILSDDAVLCIGSGCAIYPCERVRDFSEGKI
jgi:hypothetical protein